MAHDRQLIFIASFIYRERVLPKKSFTFGKLSGNIIKNQFK